MALRAWHTSYNRWTLRLRTLFSCSLRYNQGLALSANLGSTAAGILRLLCSQIMLVVLRSLNSLDSRLLYDRASTTPKIAQAAHFPTTTAHIAVQHNWTNGVGAMGADASVGIARFHHDVEPGRVRYRLHVNARRNSSMATGLKLPKRPDPTC